MLRWHVHSKYTNISLKAFCHLRHRNMIFTSLERWNQMLDLPAGQLHKDPPTAFGSAREQKWSQGENVINLKAAAQSVRAKDKGRGRKKEQMISFHHSAFLYTELELSFPVPRRDRRRRLLSDVCSGSHIAIFTWRQNGFEKTLLVLGSRSLVVKDVLTGVFLTLKIPTCLSV